jgi:hypothetical protein
MALDVSPIDKPWFDARDYSGFSSGQITVGNSKIKLPIDRAV